MSNNAYLCSSDFPDIYPSQEESYDPDRDTIAYAEYCVPLLWLALFRRGDLRERNVEARRRSSKRQTGLAPPTETVTVTVKAPLAPKNQAIHALRDAMPHLNHVFAANGSLNEHARLLGSALVDAPGRYVSIEINEIIDMMADSAKEWRAIEAILDYFDSSRPELPKKELRKMRRLISHFCPLNTKRAFISPRELWAQNPPNDDDLINLTRLLGTELFRPVPWESE